MTDNHENNNDFARVVKYVKLKTLCIRLDQLLKYAGIVDSGGQAKEMILGEEVRLNGEICLSRGKKIFPGDIITLEGVEIIVKG